MARWMSGWFDKLANRAQFLEMANMMSTSKPSRSIGESGEEGK